MERNVLEIIGADEEILSKIRTIWNDNNFRTDIPIIDLQHIWLVFLIFTLERSNRNYSPSDARLQNILDELLNFTIEHFNLEENILIQFDYPDIVKHEQEHKNFISTMQESVQSIHKHTFDLNSLVNFLQTWIVQHISIEDKGYKEYFIQKNISLNHFFKDLVNSKSITIDKAQSTIYSQITGKREVKEIINRNIVQNVINVWQANNLSVGVPVIDLQHLWLIKMIVELELTVKTSESTKRKEVFQETIKGTFQYARDHFALEEMIMQKFNYSRFTAHVKQHLNFVEIVTQRYEENLKGDISAIYNLIHDLKAWLFSHIAIEDRNIGLILRDRLNDIMFYVRELVNSRKVIISKSQLNLYNRVIGLASIR